MKKVVILGAGFGGLRAALQLSNQLRWNERRADCEITLIDRNSYHTYTPTLYEAATTSKETANYCELKKIITFPINEIVSNEGIIFEQGTIQKLDLEGGDLHLESGKRIAFDYLVLAPGSETNYFDIPGMREHALPLKTLLNAFAIRDRILEVAESGLSQIRIVIGGGGSTGVELAGEIASWIEELAEKYHFSHEICIVEASPSILFGFPNGIIQKVSERLRNLGIKLIENESIENVDPKKINLKSGRVLESDITIWTGGVKASSIISSLPLKKEGRGRVEIMNEMRCLPQSPDLKLAGTIYGLGDAICYYDPKTGLPMPGVARAAIAQADVVAHNICREILGQGPSKTYQPMKYPYVIPVGGKWAVAQIGPFQFWGFIGWILKLFVEINYLTSIMSLWKALKIWLHGLRIFVKNDRLG